MKYSSVPTIDNPFNFNFHNVEINVEYYGWEMRNQGKCWPRYCMEWEIWDPGLGQESHEDNNAGPGYLWLLALSGKHGYIVIEWHHLPLQILHQHLMAVNHYGKLKYTKHVDSVSPNWYIIRNGPFGRRPNLGPGVIRPVLSGNWWYFLWSWCQGKYGP